MHITAFATSFTRFGGFERLFIMPISFLSSFFTLTYAFSRAGIATPSFSSHSAFILLTSASFFLASAYSFPTTSALAVAILFFFSRMIRSSAFSFAAFSNLGYIFVS